jgi:hypothetical protein
MKLHEFWLVFFLALLGISVLLSYACIDNVILLHVLQSTLGGFIKWFCSFVWYK